MSQCYAEQLKQVVPSDHCPVVQGLYTASIAGKVFIKIGMTTGSISVQKEPIIGPEACN